LKTPTRLALALLLVMALCDVGLRGQAPHGGAVPVAVVPAMAATRLGQSQPCTDYRVVREGLIPMPEGVPAAHASSLVAFAGAHPWRAQKTLAAFWYAGTRESGADVQIAASTFDRERKTWDAPQWVVSRRSVGQDLGIQIRRIGNPVAWADASGRLHLFVVGTGVGGWAASHVVHLVEQAPMQFKAVRILPLTALVPTFNTSTLVRAAPLPLSDGGAVLPLYFEIGIKYGVAVRLSAEGEMQSITRITQRREVLQPTLVAHSPTHWSAWMRDYSATEMVAHSETFDAGAHWQDAGNLTLSNPGASIAALRLSSGGLMLAHNPAGRGREVLLLSTSANQPLSWTTRTLIDGMKADEYSYPTLIEAPQDVANDNHPRDVWLSYTHMRRAIAFKQLRPVCPARSQP
jgi:predicted neuraminidase